MSIIGRLSPRRSHGQARSQATLRIRTENPPRGPRRAVGRQGDGGRRRIQPGVHRAPEHLLLERHLEPPRPAAQDALDPQPRHAVRARQGARAQAPYPRRAQQRPHQGRDQGSVPPGRDLLRRARGGRGVPLRQGSIPKLKTIAFVGLGVMGKLMAARLAKAYVIRSFDLNGKGSCKSARDAAWGADALITMLPDGAAVWDAVADAFPSLRPGAVVVDMSSSDPAGTRALGRALAGIKVHMVDAPVSGARFKAKDGTLAIMVGGEKK